MTTMLTLAPTVTVPSSYSDRPSPSGSSLSARAVRPLPRKQASFVTTTTTAASSPSSSAHGTPTSRSSSASHIQTRTGGGLRSVSAGSSKAPVRPTTPVAHPAEPELRPSSTAAPAFTPTTTAAATPPTTAPAPTSAIDIHTFNPQDLLRLLATLLTRIATTNDALPSPRPSSPTSSSSSDPKPPIWSTLTSASKISLGTPSTSLSFHARNIPTISLEAYLLRILKYCPTTNEVFLALLVYFDRMSKLVCDATKRTFVIDSYNVHRLVIAGVTVASKFFSDVFYTNSRYAKVGGLPLAELNQLELQFLLLNDFRLTVHPAEMQRYADQLVLFSQGGAIPSPSPVPIPFAEPEAMTARGPYGADNDDAASECGTETGTEGGETDDEPTIRPDRSCAGSECGGFDGDEA